MLAINLKGRIVKRHPSKPETFSNREIKSVGWILKTESTRSSSNKWPKTLYRLKNIISSNTKRRKQMLNFAWNTWKYWWNETDDEILPVLAQFLRTLKFIFSRSHGKLFSVLFQAAIYIFSFKKM